MTLSDLLGIAVLLVCTGVTPFVAVIFRNRRLQIRQELLKLGRVYYVKPFAHRALLLCLTLLGLVTGILLAVFLGGGDIDAKDLGVVGGVLLPVAGACAYFLLRHNAFILLSEDEIILRYVIREKRLAYKDLESFRERNYQLPPAMVLKGTNRSLSVSHFTENFAEVRGIILKRSGLAEKSPHKNKNLPFRLKTKPYYFTLQVLGLAGIVGALTLGLILAAGEHRTESMLSFANLAPFLLIMGVIFAFFLLTFYTTEVKPGQPVRLDFEQERLMYRFPLKQEEIIRSIDEIEKIGLEDRKQNITVFYGDAMLREKFTEYVLIILFKDGEKLSLDQRRCRQFGYEPVELGDILFNFYKR